MNNSKPSGLVNKKKINTAVSTMVKINWHKAFNASADKSINMRIKGHMRHRMRAPRIKKGNLYGEFVIAKLDSVNRSHARLNTKNIIPAIGA